MNKPGWDAEDITAGLTPPCDTKMIVEFLLSEGLTMEQIVMPGTAKGIITYIADDFDAPSEEMEELT